MLHCLHKSLNKSLTMVAASIVFAPAIAVGADNGLPGVEPGHRIVKPLPPAPEETAPAGPRTFKLGDIEVVVTARVRVQFNFGGRPKLRNLPPK